MDVLAASAAKLSTTRGLRRYFTSAIYLVGSYTCSILRLTLYTLFHPYSPFSRVSTYCAAYIVMHNIRISLVMNIKCGERRLWNKANASLDATLQHRTNTAKESNDVFEKKKKIDRKRERGRRRRSCSRYHSHCRRRHGHIIPDTNSYPFFSAETPADIRIFPVIFSKDFVFWY